MRGAVEVHRLRSRLEATFSRAQSLRGSDDEVLSDLARYLCVLVCGFVEKAVAELAFEHCRARSHKTVLSYSVSQLDRVGNLNAERLSQLVRSFDSKWASELQEFLGGPRKEALDSVLALRNSIAHGQSVSLSLARITEYYSKVNEIMNFLEKTMK